MIKTMPIQIVRDEGEPFISAQGLIAYLQVHGNNTNVELLIQYLQALVARDENN